MKLPDNVKKAASAIATGIATFWAIQEIAKNYGVTLTLPATMSGYVLILAFVGLTAFPLWLGYQIHVWQVSKQLKAKTPTAETERSKGELGFELCREEDRPKIEALLNEAERHSTVWVMGIDCAYWLDDYREKVREYVTGHGHDLSIIFLIAKPDSAILETASAAKLTTPGSKGRIESSIALFQKMKSELGEKRGKIQLGSYDLPLVHSMVVVNPNTRAERIQVTHYLYKKDWVDVPNLTLRRQLLTNAQKAVFDAYHDSIGHVLENARDLDGKPLVA